MQNFYPYDMEFFQNKFIWTIWVVPNGIPIPLFLCRNCIYPIKVWIIVREFNWLDSFQYLIPDFSWSKWISPLLAVGLHFYPIPCIPLVFLQNYFLNSNNANNNLLFKTGYWMSLPKEMCLTYHKIKLLLRIHLIKSKSNVNITWIKLQWHLFKRHYKTMVPTNGIRLQRNKGKKSKRFKNFWEKV